MLTMFTLLKSLLKLVSSGLSSGVQNVSMPVSPTTPLNTQTILKIERKSVTIDGIFGTITINGVLVCESMERLDTAIAEGLYDAVLDESPHLHYVCPHIRVPMRDAAAGGDAGIRVHIANTPNQLEGCIAIGTRINGDSIEGSKDAFDKVMKSLPTNFQVLVYSVH